MNRQTNILIGLGVASLAVYITWKKYFKSKEEIPKKWRNVGILSDLMMFPVKSCGMIRVKEMDCTDIGPQVGWLKDRYFMIVDSTNEAITGRKYPKMLLIQPKAVDNIMTLSAPDMEPLNIDLKTLAEEISYNAKLFGDSFKSFDCGEVAATWFSQFLMGQPTGAKLVHFPNVYRDLKRTKENGIVSGNDTGAFSDASSYNIINASSVDDLNNKLEKPVTVQGFRPNFVVEGASAFDEDRWHWVKVGDAVFRSVKDCTRCILTTVNPVTGEKSTNNEPLATLKKYRLMKDTKQSIRSNQVQPVMGVHLALRESGIVRIGDSVLVA